MLDAPRMRIVSWNVNGLRAICKRGIGDAAALLDSLHAGNHAAPLLVYVSPTCSSCPATNTRLHRQTSCAFKRRSLPNLSLTETLHWSRAGKHIAQSTFTGSERYVPIVHLVTGTLTLRTAKTGAIQALPHSAENLSASLLLLSRALQVALKADCPQVFGCASCSYLKI